MINSLTVEPDPIVIPGNMTISAEVKTTVNLKDPLKVSPGVGRVREVLKGRCCGPEGGP